MNLRRISAVLPVSFITVFLIFPVVNTFSSYLNAFNFQKVVLNQSTLLLVWFSIWQALLSVIITFIIALPATWALSRYQFPGSKLLSGVLTTPFVLPSVVVAAGVLAITQHTGVISILWAHTIFNIAVVIRIVGPRWALIDSQLENAASTLGASFIRTFCYVIWPEISSVVKTSASLVFIYCFTSFGVISVVGGFSRRTLETEIFTQAVRLGNTEAAVSLALLQLIIVLFTLHLAKQKLKIQTSQLIVSSPQLLSSRPRKRSLVLLAVAIPSLVVALPLLAAITRSVFYQGQLTFEGWSAVLGGTLPRLSISTTQLIATSITFATATALICVPLSLIVAYQNNKQWFTYKSSGLVHAVTSLPLIASAATLGIGIIITFNRDPFAWRGKTWLLPVIHSVLALPIVIRILSPAVQAIPENLRDSASTLGASPFRIWSLIDLPILRPAIWRGIGMAVAVSLGEFSATSFLSRKNSMTLPLAISQLLGSPGFLAQQSGYVLAAIMIMVTTGVMTRA